MTAVAQAGYKEHARIHKALAHPARLSIVDALSRGERCVGELAAMVDMDMPAMSRHLSLLKSVRLLEDQRRGTRVFYRLSSTGERMRRSGRWLFKAEDCSDRRPKETP